MNITRESMGPLGFDWQGDWSSYNSGWEARRRMPEPFNKVQLVFREFETLIVIGKDYWACKLCKNMDDVHSLLAVLGYSP